MNRKQLEVLLNNASKVAVINNDYNKKYINLIDNFISDIKQDISNRKFNDTKKKYHQTYEKLMNQSNIKEINGYQKLDKLSSYFHGWH